MLIAASLKIMDSIVQNAASINAAMTAMGSGYQLTTADLSEFENYGS